jgi:hypothetical protein
MTLYARAMGAKYRAARFTPLGLKSASCVLWLDMLERGSYTVTAGSGGALPTVSSITNLASGVEWTEGSSPPFYEVAHGRPWLVNPVGSTRRIISAEADVVAAFSGDDTPFTVAVVAELFTASSTAALFGVGNSGVASSSTVYVGMSSGLPRLNRVDSAGTTSASVRAAAMQPGSRVLISRFSGSTHSMWADYESTPLPNEASVTDLTTVSPDQAALFCRPDSAPDSVFAGRLGFVAAFAGALSDEDVTRLQLWLVSRWMRPVTMPDSISGLTRWLAERLSTSGGNFTSWPDRAGLGNFTPPSGKEPVLDTNYASVADLSSSAGDCFAGAGAVSTTGELTIGVKFTIDGLPTSGQAATIASVRMHATDDDWFEVIVANQVSGTKAISFARQNGLSGTYQGFDLPDGVGLLDGSVHRLIVRYSGSTYRAWWDGVEMTVSVSGSWTRTSGDKSSLGARVSSSDGASQGMDGKLLPPMVTLSRALEDFEVAQLDLYLADGWAFSPEILPNRVLHLDMQDTDSYVVTEGSPDTVQSIRNKASEALLTEATNPPEYEADGLNGYPCMKGDGSARRLLTTSSGIVSAGSGEDKPFTIYAVMQPGNLDADQTLFSWASSADNSKKQTFVGQSAASTGRYSLAKIDDATSGAAPSSSHAVQGRPQVVAFSGTTVAKLMLNDGPLQSLTGASFDFGTVTPSRAGIFCRAQSTIDQFSAARLGELIVYAEEHTEAVQRAVARYLGSKWDVDFDPMTISGLVAWFDMQQADSYTVTAGSPDTVSSIKNLVSNTAWNTVVNAYPRYEATGLNGKPCMRVNGGADQRGIASTEAAVLAALNGTNPSMTMVAVYEPLFSGTHTIFGAGDTTVNSDNSARFGVIQATSLRTWYNRVDSSGTLGEAASATGDGLQLQPYVLSARTSGTAASFHINGVQSGTGQTVNTGAVTATRVAIGLRPDLNPDSVLNGRVSELLIFNRSLTDLELSRLHSNLMTKWGLSS